MSSLKKNGLPQGLREFFDGTTEAGNVKLQWCDTRVEALIQPNRFKLEQVKLKWFVEDKERREVNSVSVEKWFGRYCSVRGELLPQTANIDPESFTPVLFVKFITSKVETLGRNSEGIFLWKGRAFKSDEMGQALNELAQFAHP